MASNSLGINILKILEVYAMSVFCLCFFCSCQGVSENASDVLSLVSEQNTNSISSSSFDATSDTTSSAPSSTVSSTASSTASSSASSTASSSASSSASSTASSSASSTASSSASSAISSSASSTASSTVSSTTSGTASSTASGSTLNEKPIGNLFILGDSYSTFQGYIPAGYVTWYTNGGSSNTDVTNVSQTWWDIFIKRTNATFVRNDSWSGTTICNTGYSGAYVNTSSFIGRFDKLLSTNYFDENKVDTIIIFGGTNDSWAGSPIGQLQYSNWSNEDLKSVLPAFCYLLDKISNNLPDANVVVVINNGLKSQITTGMVTATREYNYHSIQLKNINIQNGHPTIAGMQQISDQIYNGLYS